MIYQNAKAFKTTQSFSVKHRHVSVNPEHTGEVLWNYIKLSGVLCKSLAHIISSKNFYFPTTISWIPTCHILSLYPYFYKFLLSSIVFHITWVIFFQWALCQYVNVRYTWVGRGGPGKGNSKASWEGKFIFPSTHSHCLSCVPL